MIMAYLKKSVIKVLVKILKNPLGLGEGLQKAPGDEKRIFLVLKKTSAATEIHSMLPILDRSAGRRR